MKWSKIDEWYFNILYNIKFLQILIEWLLINECNSFISHILYIWTFCNFFLGYYIDVCTECCICCIQFWTLFCLTSAGSQSSSSCTCFMCYNIHNLQQVRQKRYGDKRKLHFLHIYRTNIAYKTWTSKKQNISICLLEQLLL